MSTTSHHFRQMGIGLGKRRWTGAELMPPIPSTPSRLTTRQRNPYANHGRNPGQVVAASRARIPKEATAPTVSSLSEGGAITGAIRQRAASL